MTQRQFGYSVHFQSLFSICLLTYFPHSNRYATRVLSSFKIIIQPLAKAEMVLLLDIQDFGLFLLVKDWWEYTMCTLNIMENEKTCTRSAQDARQQTGITCLLSSSGFYTLYSYIYSVPVLCFCFAYQSCVFVFLILLTTCISRCSYHRINRYC